MLPLVADRSNDGPVRRTEGGPGCSSPATPPDPRDRFAIDEEKFERSILSKLAPTWNPVKPAPALRRPLLLVHGFADNENRWLNFLNYLLANPVNRFGGRIDAARPDLPLSPDGNIFEVRIGEKGLATLEEGGEQIERAIEAVRGATGASRVDLATHSMGGLHARQYLREFGSDRIDHLAMLAPPNHGSYVANLARWLPSNINPLLAPLGLVTERFWYPEEKVAALDTLRKEHSVFGRVKNRLLRELSDHWTEDTLGIKVRIITGGGLPTPDNRGLPFASGDGFVTVESARLPLEDPGKAFIVHTGIEFNHQAIVSQPVVMEEVAEFMTR